MNEPLFKAAPQSQGPIMSGETTFDFLQRGGRPEAIEIRKWIETWFREYPEEHGEELGKRLRSKKFAEFMGAYFELQIYSALRRRGCDSRNQEWDVSCRIRSRWLASARPKRMRSGYENCATGGPGRESIFGCAGFYWAFLGTLGV